MAIASPPRPSASVQPDLPPLPAGSWPEQGEWTYDDYLRLADDPGRKYEVLFGMLYLSDTPRILHQNVVTELGTQLRTFVRDRHQGILLVAPVEVRLPGIAEPVQPDILFVRSDRREIVGRQSITGAPDLVVEVLSPGTTRLDRTVKFDAYEQAGVAEYWIVNAKARFVEVYGLQGGAYELLGEYGLGEQVVSRTLPELAIEVDSLFVEE